MNREERVKMVKAMEYIARQINDESVFEGWLMNGVADGDIPYGDLTVSPEEEEADWYAKSDNWFKLTMDCFLRRMEAAAKSGGLFCDGVCSDETWKTYRVSIAWWIVGDDTPHVEEDVVQEKTEWRARTKALGRLMDDLHQCYKGYAVTIDGITVEEE